MISRLDQDVGAILAKLKEHKLDENTIVFFTSDNGPHKEGDNDPAFFDSSGPLRGIKRSLNDGGIRDTDDRPLAGAYPTGNRDGPCGLSRRCHGHAV